MLLEKKELQLGKEKKKKGWREKEKEAGSAWRFPPVCPPSTVKPPLPLATESSTREERQSNSNRVEKSNR